MRVVSLITFVGLLLATPAVSSWHSGSAHATDETVNVGDLYFCAPVFEGQVCETQVVVGDTVTWAHVQGFHTVTECGQDFNPCPKAGGFDSGTFSGGTFQQTFGQPGEFWYQCLFHPDQMRGRVLVSAAQSTPGPSPSVMSTPSPQPGLAASPTPTPAAIPISGGRPSRPASDWPLAITAGIVLLAAGAGIVAARGKLAAVPGDPN